MRKKLVVGNWKMHGCLAMNLDLLTSLGKGPATGDTTDVAVCIPYPYLAQAKSLLSDSNIAWGAQDVSQHPHGAWTGEVSGAMLSDFGCSYVLVGHSERRAYFGDTDQVVAEKFAASLEFAVCPILCVGETLAEREAGVTNDVVLKQVHAVLAEVGIGAFARAVVAYEPVWAIGTGLTATPQQAQDAHAVIRACFASADAGIANDLRILYGGSVKPSNAVELFGQVDIDGGLIGGASLVANDFLAICKAAI